MGNLLSSSVSRTINERDPPRRVSLLFGKEVELTGAAVAGPGSFKKLVCAICNETDFVN